MINCLLDRNLSEVIYDVWVFSLCIYFLLDIFYIMMYLLLVFDMIVLLLFLMVILIIYVLCLIKIWNV